MITLDVAQGVASEVGEIYRGTKSEPGDEAINVVVDMTIVDDLETICFEWEESISKVQLFLPIGRLKAILEAL